MNVHIQGMEKILSRRGGIEGLQGEALRYLVFIIDTAFAIAHDIPPRFKLPVQLMPDFEPLRDAYAVPPAVRREMTILLQRHPECREVVDILKDVSRLAQWIAHQAEQHPDFFTPKSKWCDSGTWIMPFLHRLLECKTPAPRVKETPTDDGGGGGNPSTSTPAATPASPMPEHAAASTDAIHTSLRHALILFLQPVRRKFGIVTDIGSAIHISSLRSTVSLTLPATSSSSSSSCHSSLWHLLPTSLQWILAVGGMEAETPEDRRWYAAALAGVREFREAQDAEFGKAVREFVWVDAIHDEAFGRVVWGALEEMGKRGKKADGES